MVEGAPHTAKRSMINCCVSRVPPLPPYIKEQEGGGAAKARGAPGGVLLLPGVGLPPFLVGKGEGGRRRERGRKGGRAPSLSNSD